MNRKTIQALLFEDNPGDARLFREYLREAGLVQVELDHVDRLKTGFEHLAKGKPDVILLDLGLPDSQGLETFTQVHAQAPEVPIVILTGLADADQAVKAVGAGAQDYLVKAEVSGGLLVRAIRYAIERKQSEQEIHKLNVELEKRVEERTRELCDAQEQLVRQEKLAVLGQMAGSVGHELRNPLNIINTSIYYLNLVQPEAGGKIKQHHAMIEQEVHNAEKIIADLLDFARVISVDQELVSVPELTQRVLARFPAPASVEVALEIPDDLTKVFADPRQVEQVLVNLTVNAYQAMKDGGRLTISASVIVPVPHKSDGTMPALGRQKGMVAIAVKDTGAGIMPENMKKLFEPLFTTKAKGIGLGLAVSKKLAEANSGRIEVESEPGTGSIFTLYLPANDG